MRVCLDTNVLVSAFTTRGLCADLLRLVFAEHELVCGEVILEELQRVLTQRFHVPDRLIESLSEQLRNQAVMVPRPASPAVSGVRDPDDEWIIATALDGHAEVLITGDQDLLTIKRTGNLVIYSPRSFWQRLKQA